jgi:hypothetical protein
VVSMRLAIIGVCGNLRSDDSRFTSSDGNAWGRRRSRSVDRMGTVRTNLDRIT